MSNIMKILAMGGELFHGDGRTDRHDEAIIGLAIFRKLLTIVAKSSGPLLLYTALVVCSLQKTYQIIRYQEDFLHSILQFRSRCEIDF